MTRHYRNVGQYTASGAAAQERDDIYLYVPDRCGILMRGQRAQRGERRIEQLFDLGPVGTGGDMAVVAYAAGSIIEGFRGLIGNIRMLGDRWIERVGIGDAVGYADTEVEFFEHTRVCLAKLHDLR